MGDEFEIAVSEREELANLLETMIREYLQDVGVRAVNDTFNEVFGRYSIGRYPSTPEMRFYLGDLAAFTPELVKRLRQRVLSQYENWTLVAQCEIPQPEDMEFTVSVKKLRLGSQLVTGRVSDTTKAYQRWLQKARRCDEACNGPLRRQFRHVVALLPAAIREVRRKKAVLLAAFDTFVPPIWKGDPVVWVLTRGARGQPLITPGQGQRTHVVTLEGTVEPQYCDKYSPLTGVKAPFFRHVHEFSWRNRNRLKVQLQDLMGEIKVLSTLRVKEVIHDVDLKVRLENSPEQIGGPSSKENRRSRLLSRRSDYRPGQR
jgi:hypothetical protein